LLITAVCGCFRQHYRRGLFLRVTSHEMQDPADRTVAGSDAEAQDCRDRDQERDDDHDLVQAQTDLSYDACLGTLDVKKAVFVYFFFSAFQIVRDTARPQNGQKLMGYRFGRSSGERTA